MDGATHGLIDIGKAEIRPYEELVQELLEFIEPDIEFFACADEVNHVFNILEHGTSAQKQVREYEKSLKNNKVNSTALFKVKQFLMQETLRS